MNLTRAQLDALRSQSTAPAERWRDTAKQASVMPALQPELKPKGGMAALARVRANGGMSKTELRFADRLNLMKAAGEILAWDYEADKLKLASAIQGGKEKFFKIDFTVVHASGHISFDETKGSWCAPAGMERWRWLVNNYPHRWFRMWVWDKVWTLKFEQRPERNLIGIHDGRDVDARVMLEEILINTDPSKVRSFGGR